MNTPAPLESTLASEQASDRFGNASTVQVVTIALKALQTLLQHQLAITTLTQE